jgi:hypothetical protein
MLPKAGSLLGYKHSEESLAKISKAMSERTLSEEHKAKLSLSLLGQPRPSKVKENISIAKGGGIIYVYDSQSIQVNTFSSARNAAEYFKTTHKTIMKYVKNKNYLKINGTYLIVKILS